MFAHLSIPLLLLAFAAAGAAVWVAGVYLANATSVLAKRFGLGQALGGLLLLAVVTNLPELAITVSAALSQHLELAIGNILGGIAMQTLVLVVLDVFGLGKKAALTYRPPRWCWYWKAYWCWPCWRPCWWAASCQPPLSWPA